MLIQGQPSAYMKSVCTQKNAKQYARCDQYGARVGTENISQQQEQETIKCGDEYGF